MVAKSPRGPTNPCSGGVSLSQSFNVWLRLGSHCDYYREVGMEIMDHGAHDEPGSRPM
jgi:hypothetical protein